MWLSPCAAVAAAILLAFVGDAEFGLGLPRTNTWGKMAVAECCPRSGFVTQFASAARGRVSNVEELICFSRLRGHCHVGSARLCAFFAGAGQMAAQKIAA